uniref:Calmodulin n=1 Tax=Leptocylindrus danicus TaxID=163516 RepID=A0A7S2PHZ8_9STRA|mmetsp:Transcript_33057/g.47826  ORF Transcript_33057/g.47826 Transcript_33057/m.47826 type:complete len:235 (+) Transcript_33057:57-761(+)
MKNHRSRRKSLILSSVGDTSNVLKNRSGGVALGTSACDAAIEFFGDGQGHITQESLKEVLGAFGSDTIMSDKEVKKLMNGKHYLEKKDFEESFHNEVKNYDPCAEIFQLFDPNGSGFVDTTILQNVFEKLGFGEIDEKEMKVLIRAGDMDCDGKISLDDFRSMLMSNSEYQIHRAIRANEKSSEATVAKKRTSPVRKQHVRSTSSNQHSSLSPSKRSPRKRMSPARRHEAKSET